MSCYRGDINSHQTVKKNQRLFLSHGHMILRLVIQNNIHTYFVDRLACSTRSLEHFGFMAVIHSFRMMIHIRHKIKLFPRHICHHCQFYLEHPNAKPLTYPYF